MQRPDSLRPGVSLLEPQVQEAVDAAGAVRVRASPGLQATGAREAPAERQGELLSRPAATGEGDTCAGRLLRQRRGDERDADPQLERASDEQRGAARLLPDAAQGVRRVSGDRE